MRFHLSLSRRLRRAGGLHVQHAGGGPRGERGAHALLCRSLLYYVIMLYHTMLYHYIAHSIIAWAIKYIILFIVYWYFTASRGVSPEMRGWVPPHDVRRDVLLCCRGDASAAPGAGALRGLRILLCPMWEGESERGRDGGGGGRDGGTEGG